jgi:hypothetical protein
VQKHPNIREDEIDSEMEKTLYDEKRVFWLGL